MKATRDIPLPNKYRRYPLAQLVVGESFFVPCNGEEPKKVRNRIGPTMTHLYYRDKKRFKSRTVEENGVVGIRVWRVV